MIAIILLIAFVAFSFIGLAMQFKKVGVAPWKALIPVYNRYIQYYLYWDDNKPKALVLTILELVLSAVGTMCVFYILGALGIASGLYSKLGATANLTNSISAVLFLAVTVIAIWIIQNVFLQFKKASSFSKSVAFSIGLVLLNPVFEALLAFTNAIYVPYDLKVDEITEEDLQEINIEDTDIQNSEDQKEETKQDDNYYTKSLTDRREDLSNDRLIEKERVNTPAIIGTIVACMLFLLILAYMTGKIIKDKETTKNEQLSLELMENIPEMNTIEVKLEYGENTTMSGTFSKVPDELKGQLDLSQYEEYNIEITIGDIDTKTMGYQQIPLTLTLTDKYNQSITKNETIGINVVNEITPVISLNLPYLSGAKLTKEDVINNVKAVSEEKRGEFVYSETKEDGTYYVDFGNADFSKTGTYEIVVNAYDGDQVTASKFTIIVEASSTTETQEKYRYWDDAGNVYTEEEIANFTKEGKDFRIVDVEPDVKPPYVKDEE